MFVPTDETVDAGGALRAPAGGPCDLLRGGMASRLTALSAVLS
ncbi:MAG: hypothetical protein AVDCRST_MAG88-3746 [uncultured Thermomicrobiales bacterium]|uniref:Uncharacterized protein n=1 Tax=uncultured Thermomicrobiales bacterium TaxID=1645740 RepID=A0A6J4VQ00_9BACT|nr:MAG: hypothetical protein AVDCRST_MAG88-3746 [uncultured Thermomicrobiales bacterium]